MIMRREKTGNGDLTTCRSRGLLVPPSSEEYQKQKKTLVAFHRTSVSRFPKSFGLKNNASVFMSQFLFSHVSRTQLPLAGHLLRAS
jgi:hypothetical protein